MDFAKRRRIAVTGSATSLTREGLESGVGRWMTIRLATLSFYEALQLRRTDVPTPPQIASLADLFHWEPRDFLRVGEDARPLVGHFHDYLLRGGFPQCALVPSLDQAQKLLREDIVDKVLKRDMTALFGVRRVIELEQVFLYLSLHGADELDMPGLCRQLGLKRPTVSNFVDLLEATLLIYRLLPFGYGKEVLRGRPKIYLADPAIGPSVLLKGKSLLEDPEGLGVAVETAFFRHVFARYYRRSLAFSYWRGRRGHEVDMIANAGGDRLVPFEVKYRAQVRPPHRWKGLAEFCRERKVGQAYLITQDVRDFGVMDVPDTGGSARVLMVPAALACYWLDATELAD